MPDASDSQRVASPGLEPRVRVELDQVVEQQRHHLAALHVARHGGVERGGVGAQVVDEPVRAAGVPHGAGGGQDEQAREQRSAEVVNDRARMQTGSAAPRGAEPRRTIGMSEGDQAPSHVDMKA